MFNARTGVVGNSVENFYIQAGIQKVIGRHFSENIAFTLQVILIQNSPLVVYHRKIVFKNETEQSQIFS